jgi:hypothetical protein
MVPRTVGGRGERLALAVEVQEVLSLKASREPTSRGEYATLAAGDILVAAWQLTDDNFETVESVPLGGEVIVLAGPAAHVSDRGYSDWVRREESVADYAPLVTIGDSLRARLSNRQVFVCVPGGLLRVTGNRVEGYGGRLKLDTDVVLAAFSQVDRRFGRGTDRTGRASPTSASAYPGPTPTGYLAIATRSPFTGTWESIADDYGQALVRAGWADSYVVEAVAEIYPEDADTVKIAAFQIERGQVPDAVFVYSGGPFRIYDGMEQPYLLVVFDRDRGVTERRMHSSLERLLSFVPD